MIIPSSVRRRAGRCHVADVMRRSGLGHRRRVAWPEPDGEEVDRGVVAGVGVVVAGRLVVPGWAAGTVRVVVAVGAKAVGGLGAGRYEW